MRTVVLDDPDIATHVVHRVGQSKKADATTTRGLDPPGESRRTSLVTAPRVVTRSHPACSAWFQMPPPGRLTRPTTIVNGQRSLVSVTAAIAPSGSTSMTTATGASIPATWSGDGSCIRSRSMG